MKDDRDQQTRPGPARQAVSPAGERTSPSLDRRKFLGALGATAAAAAFMGSEGAKGSGQSATPPAALYQDSFGNIGPANPAALAAGAVPPPTTSSPVSPDNAGDTPTYVLSTYKQRNILMIMVDQMGTQRWIPSAPNLPPNLPNIGLLQQNSFVFPNYSVAAAACTPSRACLLTGLYSQQTYIFNTLENWCEPQLQSYSSPNGGFPTIGDVLSQKIPIYDVATKKFDLGETQGYDTVWIGKWHLSAIARSGGQQPVCVPGSFSPGPGDISGYGFNDPNCLPTNTPTSFYNSPAVRYASPDGVANEGVGGYLLDESTLVSSLYPPPNPPLPLNPPGYSALCDGAIADAFGIWIKNAAPTAQPWFCAVSFVNPHDMSGFPYAYNLASPPNFGPPNGVQVGGYPPPPTGGYNPAGHPDEQITTIPPVPTSAPAGPPGTGPNGVGGAAWNYNDSPKTQTYGPTGGVYGKPTLQYYYQHLSASEVGSFVGENSWLMFLQYYYWMQQNIDLQVGRVLNAPGFSNFAGNTIIIFTSDHGDYAGSHWLHGKGWALYDETMNVPLYIQYPGQKKQVVLPNACSAVDILPFIYSTAIGNDSWRNNSKDIVGYLWKREAINDFIWASQGLNFSPLQRRVTGIPMANPSPTNPQNQPYILHTTDEGFKPATDPANGNLIPNHAIAFRTLDFSTTPNGGGKLGMYSYWNHTLGAADGVPPTQPDTNPPPSGSGGPQQFEFYNYSAPGTNANPDGLPANYGEAGNQVVTVDGNGNLSGWPGRYQSEFNAIVMAELYPPLSMPNNGTVPTYITSGQTQALMLYLNYVNSQAGQNDTTWET